MLEIIGAIGVFSVFCFIVNALSVVIKPKVKNTTSPNEKDTKA